MTFYEFTIVILSCTVFELFDVE